MSGYRSKKLMAADRPGPPMIVTVASLELAKLMDAMHSFNTEEELMQWHEKLPLAQSQLVDSLLLTMLLGRYDAIIDATDNYVLAQEYLSKFRLQS